MPLMANYLADNCGRFFSRMPAGLRVIVSNSAHNTGHVDGWMKSTRAA